MRILVAILMLVVGLSGESAKVTPLEIHVADATGEPFPDVLVIVKSLENKGEMFRALTDSAGSVTDRTLEPGFYRAIATCPYGTCKTSVQEFLVDRDPVALKMKLDVWPTRGNTVTIGQTAQLLTVRILMKDAKPAASTKLLVRDKSGTVERWYTTDKNGEAVVDLPDDPTILLVPHGDALIQRTVDGATVEKLQEKGETFVIRLEEDPPD